LDQNKNHHNRILLHHRTSCRLRCLRRYLDHHRHHIQKDYQHLLAQQELMQGYYHLHREAIDLFDFVYQQKLHF
jgi:hypothetical protein